MATKNFSYQEEKDGLLAEYIEDNPVYYRRNWPTYVEILTGEDIPNNNQE